MKRKLQEPIKRTSVELSIFGQWAHYYGGLGLRPFPVAVRTKDRPLINAWNTAASSDETAIRVQWARHPDANIAIATGGEPNIIDIETDRKEVDGETVLQQWCVEHGLALPLTWTFRSGSGGIHRLYRAQRSLRNRAGILPSVDVRADGGYAIFPPSVHPNGRLYEWLPGCSPAEMPDGPALLPFELFDLLTSGARHEGKPLELPAEIPEGQRNDTMFRIACSFREKGLSYDEVRVSIQGVNDQRCNPPLDDVELDTICRQACSYKAGEGLSRIVAQAATTEESFRPSDFSDVANSYAFARFVQGDLIYVSSRGLYAWNGTVWEQDDQAAVSMAKAFTDHMHQEATGHLFSARTALTTAQAGGDNAQKAAAESAEKDALAYLSHTMRSRAHPRVRAMVDLATPDLSTPLDRLDADPFLLNTPAGMIDLRTGAVLAHDRAAYCTSITGVSPSERGAELWRAFIEQITVGDDELAQYLQQVAGMAAVGRVYTENLLIAHGAGKNGKSTFFNVQSAVLGRGYAGSINPEALTTDKQNKGADLAELKGKRFIVAAELEEGKRLSTSVLKRLTSTDEVQAERKYKDPEGFTPTHTTVLFTNHLPRLGTLDGGTKRRLTVVPFRATIPAKGEIKNYAQYLFENAGGAILSWIIEGARVFCADGFTLHPPVCVQEATGKYFAANDWMSRFMEECCIIDKGRRCAGGGLYRQYSMWASSEDNYVRNNNDFAAELEVRGFRRVNVHGVKTWHGIDVRAYSTAAAAFLPRLPS